MPPYPGIPYGLAPSWCFPVFEYGMYLLFVFCLANAIKQGKKDVAYLLGGLVFGLVLEYVEVISGGGYRYGQFTLMFGHAPLNIPLCIGIGWSIIIYTSRLFSDSLGLTLWACAAFDTLLALNMDLSMDTIAYRLHMWHWNWVGTGLNPLTAGWFGVPFGNFFGWQMVIFFYSAFSRLFEKRILKAERPPVVKVILTTLLALLCSEILLFLMESYIEDFLYKKLGITSLDRFLGALVILIIIAARGWRKKKTPAKQVPTLAWSVPAGVHFFFFACLFLAGFYLENFWMTFASCVNLLIAVAIHIAPLSVFKKRLAV